MLSLFSVLVDTNSISFFLTFFFFYLRILLRVSLMWGNFSLNVSFMSFFRSDGLTYSMTVVWRKKRREEKKKRRWENGENNTAKEAEEEESINREKKGFVVKSKSASGDVQFQQWTVNVNGPQEVVHIFVPLSTASIWAWYSHIYTEYLRASIGTLLLISFNIHILIDQYYDACVHAVSQPWSNSAEILRCKHGWMCRYCRSRRSLTPGLWRGKSGSRSRTFKGRKLELLPIYRCRDRSVAHVG